MSEEIPLYAGRAPGSESWTHSEQRAPVEHLGTDVLFNVVEPSLTVFRPEHANGTGVIICPGGGFHLLAYHHEGIDVARWLNDSGVTAFVLKYRLVPCEINDPHQQINERARARTLEPMVADLLPLAVADGRRALEIVRSRADEFDLAPTRTGMIGFSAGATLTMALAMDQSVLDLPDFLAPIYPHYGWVPDHAVPRPTPPMFIAAATDDALGFASHATELYLDWINAGGEAELHLYQRGGHGFGMRKQGTTADRWIQDLADWMEFRELLRPT